MDTGLAICKTCGVNGDLEKCRKTPCQYHGTFIVKALEKRIREIMKYKKQTIFINSKDNFDRQNPENNYHGWNDPEHMKESIKSLLTTFHYIIKLSLVDDPLYDHKYPITVAGDIGGCRTCESNNGIKKCIDTDCMIHETFIFEQLITKLRRIQYSTENLKWLEDFSDPYQVQHHCANYDSIALQIFRYMEIDKPGDIETEKNILDACIHSWCDIRNAYKGGPVVSGEMCHKCGKLRAGNFDNDSMEWMENGDNDDDIYTLKDFIDCCTSGGFIDYDGYGHYGTTECHVWNTFVHPSDITRGRIDYRFSHVIWYNR